MASFTPGYAKNIIRRAFRQIIDQPPANRETDGVWEFFASECAYCGKKLNKANKDGHIDHLVSASKGGRNHISNRILSCATCNEKEKRDLQWQQWLASKIHDQALLEYRRKKILDWQTQNFGNLTEQFRSLADSADRFASEVVEFLELKIAE